MTSLPLFSFILFADVCLFSTFTLSWMGGGHGRESAILHVKVLLTANLSERSLSSNSSVGHRTYLQFLEAKLGEILKYSPLRLSQSPLYFCITPSPSPIPTGYPEECFGNSISVFFLVPTESLASLFSKHNYIDLLFRAGHHAGELLEALNESIYENTSLMPSWKKRISASCVTIEHRVS